MRLWSLLWRDPNSPGHRSWATALGELAGAGGLDWMIPGDPFQTPSVLPVAYLDLHQLQVGQQLQLPSRTSPQQPPCPCTPKVRSELEGAGMSQPPSLPLQNEGSTAQMSRCRPRGDGRRV